MNRRNTIGIDMKSNSVNMIDGIGITWRDVVFTLGPTPKENSPHLDVRGTSTLEPKNQSKKTQKE